MKKFTLAPVALAITALSTPAFAAKEEQKTPTAYQSTSVSKLGKIDAPFNALDNDKNDYISMEEADDNDIWEHFAFVDTDNDLNISREEYTVYMETNLGLVADDAKLIHSAKIEHDREKIDNDFSTLDNNENGFISRDESDDDAISEHFGLIDTNRDDAVSVQEYNSYISKHGKKVAKSDALETAKK